MGDEEAEEKRRYWMIRNMPSDVVERLTEHAKRKRLTVAEAVSEAVSIWLDNQCKADVKQNSKEADKAALEARLEAMEKRLEEIDGETKENTENLTQVVTLQQRVETIEANQKEKPRRATTKPTGKGATPEAIIKAIVMLEQEGIKNAAIQAKRLNADGVHTIKGLEWNKQRVYDFRSNKRYQPTFKKERKEE